MFSDVSLQMGGLHVRLATSVDAISQLSLSYNNFGRLFHFWIYVRHLVANSGNVYELRSTHDSAQILNNCVSLKYV